MKAIRVLQFGGPEVLKLLENVPLPKPENNQILVRVKCAGINPVDTYIRSGTHKIKPELPYTPGSDGAGTIESCAHCKTDFKKGDRVYFKNAITGSYAEYALVEEKNVFRLHDTISFGAGAAIGVPYFTAYRAIVLKCHAKAGQTILIHGASGAVGLAACQIARQLELTVLGTAGSEAGIQLVIQNGAQQAFNHNTEDYTEKILEATNNKGVDITVEMLANVNLERDLCLAAHGGTIAIVGNRGTIEITPRHAMTKELTIVGVMMQLATDAESNEAAAFLDQGMESGWLKPHVGQEYSLTEIAKAHMDVIEHTGGTRGKMVLKVSE